MGARIMCYPTSLSPESSTTKTKARSRGVNSQKSGIEWRCITLNYNYDDDDDDCNNSRIIAIIEKCRITHMSEYI